MADRNISISKGKFVVGFIALSSIAAGIFMYYTQVHAYYTPVTSPEPVKLTLLASGEPETILAEDLEVIDATSSPIRYRACFTTPMSHAMLSETYQSYTGAIPLTAPSWFPCFDAVAIGAALEDGTALAFTGQENIEYGVDRIVAITEDGRGYVWHQLNNCGQKAYDGSPVGPDCPPRP